jgi:hypothetical protein
MPAEIGQMAPTSENVNQTKVFSFFSSEKKTFPYFHIVPCQQQNNPKPQAPMRPDQAPPTAHSGPATQLR